MQINSAVIRSLGQNQEELNTFLDNLQSNLETVALCNPFLTILISDLTLNEIIDLAIWIKLNIK